MKLSLDQVRAAVAEQDQVRAVRQVDAHQDGGTIVARRQENFGVHAFK